MDPAETIAGALCGEPRTPGAAKDPAPAAAHWLNHPTTHAHDAAPFGSLRRLLWDIEAEIARGEDLTHEEALALFEAELKSGRAFARDEAAARAAGELPDDDEAESHKEENA